MAEVRRFNSWIPDSGIDFEAFTAPGVYVSSIIIANLSSVKETKVSVWILPYEFTPIPSGESEEDYRIYIIKDGVIPPSGSYETWRFSMTNNDVLYYRSNNGMASFTAQGINQSA